MPSEISKTYDVKYRENMRFKLQQQKPKLAPLAMRESCSGEMFLLENLVGNRKSTKRTTRNQDTTYGNSEHDRVWAAQPGADEYSELVDAIDKVASGIDLNGAYVKGGAQTINRAWDDAFIGGFDGTFGFYGNMLMGKTGGTSVPFASGNIVPVATGAAAATGLNVTKVMAARKILAKNFVDLDQPLYMGVSAEQVEDLFQNVQVQSEDFKRNLNIRVSDDGKKLLGVLGFELVEFEFSNPLLHYASLTLDGSGYRRVPFWSADGMAMCVWEDLFTSVDTLPTKGHSTQVFARTMVTATRTDNGRCGQILCAE